MHTNIFTLMSRALLLMLVFSTGPAWADTIEELSRDFAVVEGTLILARGEQYLVDLDAGQGLRAGDMLVAASGGESVIHPRSGEVIGTLGVTQTIFQVLKVDRGFSRLQRMGSDNEVAAGTRLVRWRGLSAALISAGSQSRKLYADLQENLPQLLWQGDFVATGELPQGVRADLLFVVEGDRLLVNSVEGQELRSYVLPPQTAPDTVAAVSVGQRESAAAASSGYRSLGRLPGATRMASFCRVGETLLLAATDGRRLRLYAVSNNLKELAELPLPGLEEGLTLSWWQPAPDENPFLVVTSAVQRDVANSPSVETEISSSIYTYADGNLQRRFHLIGLLLGSFDLEGDGRFETLFAEPFPEAGTPSGLAQVKITDGKLEHHPLKIKVPGGFGVNGTAIVDLGGDGSLEFARVADSFLTIDGDGHPAYRSVRKMGGSLSRLTYDQISGGTAPLFTTRVFEIPPLAVDLNQDGHRELLVVSGRQGVARAPGLGPGIEESWVSIVAHHEGRYLKQELGPHLETPLQGLGFDGRRLLVVKVQPNDFFGQGGETEVLALDIKR